MAFVNIDDLKKKVLLEGIEGRFIHTDNLTIGYFDIKKGSLLPEHSHANEQVTHIIEGRLEMTVKGEIEVLEAGKVAVIPAHAVHSAKALSDCKAIDVFYPCREDYKG